MEYFGTALIVVALVAIVVACLSYIGSGGIYRGLGRTGLSLDEPELRPEPVAGSPAAHAEIRQMLEAKSARREARGERPLDVAAEMAALGNRASAASLREEVRQLVVAGNERRERRGEEPLDVETEIERRLEELGA